MIVKTGDLIVSKHDWYVEDYIQESHHFICRSTTQNIKKIYIPGDSLIFGYIDPIRIIYKLPDDFNMHEMLFKDGKYFLPEIPYDFEEKGAILWKCIGVADPMYVDEEEYKWFNFISYEESEKVIEGDKEVAEYYGKIINKDLLSGTVERMFRKVYDYNCTPMQTKITYMKSLDIGTMPNKYLEDYLSNTAGIYTIVMSLEDGTEIYFPHTSIKLQN